MIKKYLDIRLLPLVLASLFVIMTACNKEEDSTLSTVNMNVPAVAVTNFYLRADNKVLANLDSVFFSIDLENGVIFNADSLPKGTNIEKLVPVMTFSSTIETATIEMTGGNRLTGTSDYKTNPTDTLDFSGDVRLTLTSSDDLSRTYRIKVNVHKSEPDSLTWGEMAYAKLPSRTESPRCQRTLTDGSTVYCLTEESDGSFTLASSTDLFSYNWEKRTVSLPEGADPESVVLTDNKFYVLDSAGRLMQATPEEMAWTATGETWASITGIYDTHVLGLALRDGIMCHAHYPAGGDISDPEMKPGFPVRGHSQTQNIENDWSTEPTIFLFGGITASGETSSSTWAFDGDSWIEIDNGGVPALSNATLIPYYNYRKTSTSWIQTEYRVWILFGGRMADGSLNRTLYLSYDNGVNWRTAPDKMQLPAYIPAMEHCDCATSGIHMESDLADAWTRAAVTPTGMRKIAYDIDGYDISWECPYIFLFGGHTADGRLSNTVWRGVLERLRFTPLI